jgi:hypothetical protein
MCQTLSNSVAKSAENETLKREKCKKLFGVKTFLQRRCTLYTDKKKENEIFLIYKEIQMG